MTDPDVRLVVLGLPREERKIQHLLRRRARAERLAARARRELERVDRQLRQLEREVRRGA